MKIFNVFSLLLSLFVQAYIVMVGAGIKSTEFHALPIHVSSSGKDTSVGYLK